MQWRLYALALALALGLSSGADGAIFDQDDRLSVGVPRDSTLGAIGKVSSRTRQATGFLVSECHVLTVRHLFGDKKAPHGKRVNFRTIPHTGRYLSSEGTVIANGELANPSKNRSDDWMLILLDTCLGSTVGFLDIFAPRSIIARDVAGPLRMAGYPKGKPFWLVMDPSCRIRNATDHEWFNDCASLLGNSGSPIFRQHKAGGKEGIRVIGMQTSGLDSSEIRNYDSYIANRATRIHILAAAIAPYLRERHSSAGQD